MAFPHIVHQAEFTYPVFVIATLAVDMHWVPGADPVGVGLGATWSLHGGPATLALLGSVGGEVPELATTEGLAPI